MDFATLAAALSIMVRLHGHTAPDRDLLNRAQKRVTAILSHSGIEIVWRSCGEPSPPDAICNATPGANEAVIRFLAGPSTETPDSCGVALVPREGHGHFISLFVDCVHAAADRLSVAEDVVLGGVLAHEIGHLLLGTSSHGSIGLMQAQPRPIDWQRAARDALGFTKAEARKLRESVRRRMNQRE
jgi:hypothetical protein